MADQKGTSPTPGSQPSPTDPEVDPTAADRTSADRTAADPTAGEPGPVDDAGASDVDRPADEPGTDPEPSGAELVDEPTDAELAAERGDGDEVSSREPALVGAPASRRPVRRERAEAVEPTTGKGKKGRATRRREDAEEAETRTGPVTFVNQSVAELRKVVWPTAEQMRTYFVVVLVFVVFMITVVSLLDLLFGWALLQVFR